MTQGPFNTDTRALERRIQAHDKFAEKDLNAWIFEHLAVQAGARVLDLGCGTGKQSIPIAKTVGATGHVISVDASADAVATVRASARDQGIEERITPIQCGLDDVPSRLSDEHFDRVVASYSIYYVKDPEPLFAFVRRVLTDGGLFFACGPSSENNGELKDFHFGLPGAGKQKPLGASVFLEQTAPEILRRLFGRIEMMRFENPLRFDSADALYSYWSSYNLFDQNLAEAFREHAARHFSTNPTFTTVKRVVGIRAQRG